MSDPWEGTEFRREYLRLVEALAAADQREAFLRARAEQAERELAEANAIIATAAEGYMTIKARVLALADEWDKAPNLYWSARTLREAVEGGDK